MHSALGDMALTEMADSILDGTFQPPEHLNRGTKAILKQFKMKDSIREEGLIPADMPYESFDYYWNGAREMTSSGVSKLHYGHLKAGKYNKHGRRFDHGMMQVVAKSGYSPKRHKRSVNVMLLKKLMEYLVSCLRCINLMEPDYQELCKDMARKAMHNALKHGAMCPENFGGIKGRNQIQATIVKLLFFDMLRQRKIPGSDVLDDAISCYNRILHTVMSLSFQQYGIPKPQIKSIITTLQDMVHQVRTPFGDSVATHGPLPTDTRKPGGAYQGVGHGPACYAGMSSAMNNALREGGFGLDVKSALSKTHH
jgi:hypothetical protein